MRSFNVVFIVIFLLFYLTITYGTYKGLIKLVRRKNVSKQIFLFSQLILLCIIGIFYFYYSPTNSLNFYFYTVLNALFFVDFIFKIPLSFFWLIFRISSKKYRSPSILYSGLILSIGLSFTLIYGITLGNKEMKVVENELNFSDCLPPNFDSYKIVQISDIHLGSFGKSNLLLEKALKSIQEISPDIILFTGDLVNNFANEISEQQIELIKNSLHQFPCFSILGNHDYGNYSRWETEEKREKNFDSIVELHQQLGFRLLRNEHVLINEGKDSIFLIGVENWGHPPFPQYANLNKAMHLLPENSFKLLLTHDPAHWESKVKGLENIQLSLAGHTHGLQWGLKTAGIPFSLSHFVRNNWGGLYENNDNYLYVNTGLGMVGVQYRIDMPAEISVFTLKRVKID